MRIPLSVPIAKRDLLRAVSGTATDCSLPETVNTIVTDSREAEPGDLFFALTGENFDGHDYVPRLLKEGVFVVSSRPFEGAVLVNDTRVALGALASFYKDRLPCLRHTVGITGSVGKTTVKNFLSALLGSYFRVHKTIDNFNNDIGLPLSLLSAPADTEILVLEMGTNATGEIENLAAIARPDLAIITCVGTAHIGRFGSREAIAKEKSAIAKGLPKSGKLLIPANEPLLAVTENAVTVSTEEHADVMLIPRSETENGTLATYYGKQNTFDLSLSLPGRGVLTDLAFAVAAAEEIGVPAPYLLDAIGKIDKSLGRVSSCFAGGVEIIDDSYNASLESVLQGLRMLKMKSAKRKIVLLGDILESGGYTDAIHREIGRSLKDVGVDQAFFFGVYSDYYRSGARDGGLKDCQVGVNLDTEAPGVTKDALLRYLRPGDVLYCKASHGVHLSRIITPLSQSLQTKG